ncbi:MAG TPA: LarC family nickel insertion protein [bacterium]|nr:LarC family nickel insertion protein [bacterium]HOL50191.1 LarC family nickel insertion protein [bacterium]HPO51554.1 LarC family nickel insertion protein [bacterium]
MIGYFDIKNGCAGDMVCAALSGCVDVKEIERHLKKVKFPSRYEIEIRQVMRAAGQFHGIKANQFIVNVSGKEHERSYREIVSIFSESDLLSSTKKKILKIFSVLAEAESKVHGRDLEQLHFHAVGQTDALVEISFSVLAMEYIGITKLVVSSVGISNAAPATMEMISKMPVIFRNIPFEISTPTGIAIIKGLADFYGDSPTLMPLGYAYGTGTITTDLPNTVEFVYGTEMSEKTETIGIIETSVDDMNPLIFEHLIDKLHQAGALEVCFFTGTTKKSRPMFLIRVLCKPEQRATMSKIIFHETTSLGIRYREENRIVLGRAQKKIKTSYGEIRVKFGYFAGETVNIMPEYEDCKKIAIEKRIPIKIVMQEAVKSAIESDR